MWNPNGKLGDASKYAPLKWSSTAGAYNTTGGATTVWNGKSHNDDYLMLGLDGGHPGRPGYYAITGYTIQADDGAGLYSLIGSSIMKSDASQDRRRRRPRLARSTSTTRGSARSKAFRRPDHCCRSIAI